VALFPGAFVEEGRRSVLGLGRGDLVEREPQHWAGTGQEAGLSGQSHTPQDLEGGCLAALGHLWLGF
jgi:hypothetical protein